MELAVFGRLCRSAGVHFGGSTAGAVGGMRCRLLYPGGNLLSVGSVAEAVSLHFGHLGLLGIGMGLRLGDVGVDVEQEPSRAVRSRHEIC